VKDKRLLGELIAQRQHLKETGQKLQADAIKRVLAITFGAQGYENSKLYDLGNRRRINWLGQLMIVDLLEKLEP